MTTTEMDALRERAIAAGKVAAEARMVELNAWAELARIDLLKFVDEHPEAGIIGLSFETTYEYDDEGGYFPTPSIYPLVGDDADRHEADPEYEFHDMAHAYGHDVLAVLCGVDTDELEGQITVAEARERRF